MKKILYIKGSWLWDIISSIPKLSELKKWWENKIFWLFTSNFNENYWKMLSLLSNRCLINEIIKIDFNLITLLKYSILNFKKYDEVIVWWICTYKTKILAHILWKKAIYNRNSINTKDDIVKSETWIIWRPFFSWNIFNDFKNNDTISIYWKYASIYWSIDIRTLEEKEWIDIWKYLQNFGYKIILLWWARELWLKKLYDQEWIQHINKIWDLMSLWTY